MSKIYIIIILFTVVITSCKKDSIVEEPLVSQNSTDSVNPTLPDPRIGNYKCLRIMSSHSLNPVTNQIVNFSTTDSANISITIWTGSKYRMLDSLYSFNTDTSYSNSPNVYYALCGSGPCSYINFVQADSIMAYRKLNNVQNIRYYGTKQ